MLRINKDDLFGQKIEETKTTLQVILMDCFHKNCSEVIECDSIDTANSIMNYYWEHATDYLPDWWCKDIEIKRKNGVNTFYIWINT